MYSEGTVATWLVFGPRIDGSGYYPGQVWGDIVLRHLTLAVPLSTQVYKWVPANSVPGKGNPAMV